MQALRVAERCGRLGEVDQFLNEIDADRFAELEAYDQLYPTGWPALVILAQRLSWIIAQCHSGKKLREQDFALKISPPKSPEAAARVEDARFRAYAIRSQIAADAMKEHG